MGEEYCKFGRYSCPNLRCFEKCDCKHENEICDCTIKAPYTFGSATALVCAHTPEAVRLLLARGAKTNVWYTPAQHNQVLDPRTVLATHLVLRHGSDRDQIVQALWSAVANDDLVAAKAAYAKGASPDLWFAGGVAIPYSEYTSHMNGEGQNGYGIRWSAAYRNAVWPSYNPFFRNAVCKDNTSIFFDNATEPHLMTHGLTTLMKASQNNSLEMMNWLIDVGVRFFLF